MATNWIRARLLRYARYALSSVLLLLAVGSAFLYSGQPQGMDFDTFECRSEPFWSPQQETENLVVRSDGTCVYRNEGRPAGPNGFEPWPARTYEHTIDSEKMARLKRLLAQTRGLTHPDYRTQAIHTHPTTYTITLGFDGQTRQIVCEGQQPEPYSTLIWWIRTIARQERALYVLQEADESERFNICRDLTGEIGHLRGETGRMAPVFDVDYRRYVPEFLSYVTAPEAHLDKDGYQLIAAIKVLAYTRSEAAYNDIAALALHDNDSVRRAAVTALGDIGRPEYIDELVRAGELPFTDEDSAWTLIRMGDIAVPAIAEVLAANRGELAYKLVRAYINHWDELPGPVDEQIIDAVRVGMSKRGDPYDAYYGYVLDLARARPIEPAPMLGRLDYRDLVCYGPSTFVHGWYTIVDGRIDRYGVAPATDTATGHLMLKVFEPEIAEGTLRFTVGWTDLRYVNGRRKDPLEQTVELPVPAGSQLETDYVCYRRDMPTGTYGNVVRITNAYQLLWQGRVVKDGRDVLTLAYTGKLARPTDAGQEFSAPRRPLEWTDPPPFRR
ncbi:MAG: HEAT repeat domain-containing protein [Sedimentisphaerales bacterium]|nr:HEAT repeat domain-containing protein [Sedimentisphaerales bacterium]